MKILRYKLSTKVNYGTEEEPKMEEILYPIKMGWNESNEKIAKREAYNGEYTVEDDDQPETEVQSSVAERIAELEEALTLLLSGVTE